MTKVFGAVIGLFALAGVAGYAIGKYSKSKDSTERVDDIDDDFFMDDELCCQFCDGQCEKATEEAPVESAEKPALSEEVTNGVNALLDAVEDMADAVIDACPKHSDVQKALHEKTAKAKEAVANVRKSLEGADADAPAEDKPEEDKPETEATNSAETE